MNIDALNTAQRAAVCAAPGHVLVLAGAGSGKTRVLVHRMAWLLEQGYHPADMLAVTFTNKAAGEMKQRMGQQLGHELPHLWVGTFHSLAHKLLRRHHRDAGLDETFQIMDSDDQHRLIKRILKNLELDEQQWAPKQVQWFINHQKDAGHRSHQVIVAPGDLFTATMSKIYLHYEQVCQQNHLVDFAELLLRVRELWSRHPDVLAHYQQRFRYVLVDEFQDTNAVQYTWLKQLVPPHGDNHLMIVGDDDQSIYGWRGARVENIQRFLQDYPKTTTVRLEQNYRSTGTILKAANTLIQHNPGRMGKELWSAGDCGTPITLYSAYNEIDEARFVAHGIQVWCEQGGQRCDVAILYRSNAQSRILEEALLQAQIPYRIYGGQKFFERAEIKDALAYLRLVAHPDDDPSFERVVNLPARGLGERSVSLLREQARTQQQSMWQAAQHLLASDALSARVSQALLSFIQVIEGLVERTAHSPLPEIIECVIKDSGLWAHHQAQKGEKAQGRLENLEELVNAGKHFVPEDSTVTPLQSFLSHAALEAGEGQADPSQDSVQLMTLHSAKGLEFPLVYMVGMEEGLFPHALSVEDGQRLEEERRLCYVGMTRAMTSLVLTHAEIRRQWGKEAYHKPSRFIGELPDDCIQAVRMQGRVTRTTAASKPKAVSRPAPDIQTHGFNLGQPVFHHKFGEGVIMNFEGRGEGTRVEVRFRRHGLKWLVLAYAALQAA